MVGSGSDQTRNERHAAEPAPARSADGPSDLRSLGSTYAGFWREVTAGGIWYAALDAAGTVVTAPMQIATSTAASLFAAWNGLLFGLVWVEGNNVSFGCFQPPGLAPP